MDALMNENTKALILEYAQRDHIMLCAIIGCIFEKNPSPTDREIKDGTVLAEAYAYDPLGRRASTTAGGVTVRHVYDGAHCAADTDSSGTLLRSYSWATGLYNFRLRWYDPATGRWLSKDPIGISGGLNLYAFCGNDPVNLMDPFGLWGIQFGNFNLGYGDPWMLFDNSSWKEVSKGAAATLDGIIPFYDPFEISYADECGNVDSVYKISRHLGAFSRDIYLGARIPNMGEWIKHPILYEAGSATVPTRVFKMIEGLSPTWRGRWLRAFGETFGPFGVGEMAAAYRATWNTGFTPGGRLLLELIPFSVTDSLMRLSK